ncbi:MAG TPA: acyltransferase [Terriglobales bacterium]|nr:acyltransferase [Terriglobales bacterium]
MASHPYPSSLEAATREHNLPSLDGLRAVAVFLVVFYHSGLPVNGGLGVLMFFVISGFLITWLLLQEEKRWGDISLKLFYIRRTLRIFPAFYVFWLLVVVGFVVLGKRVHVGQAAASFFYVTNYYQALLGDPDTALSHTWSLAIEEQFYLLWPLAFLLLGNARRRMHALMIVIPLVWVYRIVSVLWFHVWQGYVYEALDMRADHLLVGCLLATVLHQKSAPRLWQLLGARPWTLWITVGGLALSSEAPHLLHHAWRYRDLVGFTIDPILTAILIVQAMTFSQISACWLNWGWMRLLGRMSYSIYLYQQVTLSPPRHLLKSAPLLVQLIAGIATCLAFSAASYYFVERPFQTLKERIGTRAKKQAVEVDPSAATS